MEAIRISPVDAVFADGSYPIAFLLYYRERLDVGRLWDALGRMAVPFWPVFGTYEAGRIWEGGTAPSIRVLEGEAFDPGRSAEALHARYAGVGHLPADRLFDLTLLQCPNGSVLLSRMQHLAGDGYSYFEFLSALAAACRDPARADIPAPRHARNPLLDFSLPDVPREPAPPPGRVTLRTECVSRRAIRAMRARAASAHGCRVSPNDLLCAMVLQHTFRARAADCPEPFSLTIPIDVRSRVAEYGPRFFGNALQFHQAAFDPDEIRSESVEALAVRIRESMPSVSRASYAEYLASLARRLRDHPETTGPFDPGRGCLVTNLSRLPATRLDFGTGRPDTIALLTVERNSAAILGGDDHVVLRMALPR